MIFLKLKIPTKLIEKEVCWSQVSNASECWCLIFRITHDSSRDDYISDDTPQNITK